MSKKKQLLCVFIWQNFAYATRVNLLEVLQFEEFCPP